MFTLIIQPNLCHQTQQHTKFVVSSNPFHGEVYSTTLCDKVWQICPSKLSLVCTLIWKIKMLTSLVIIVNFSCFTDFIAITYAKCLIFTSIDLRPTLALEKACIIFFFRCPLQCAFHFLNFYGIGSSVVFT
jgi:hypothetical protein